MFNTAVTLISDPAAPALDAPAYEAAIEAIASAGVTDWTVAFLSPGVAADFKVACDDRAGLAVAVETALAALPVDVVVQPLLSRRKRLLVADMDSTIIEQECLDELADFAGLKAEIAAVTERAMRGELDFETALRSRVAMLKGLSEEKLDETFRTRITLTPGAETLVATMKANGARAVLVSGGFVYFVSRLAAAAGFDHF
ncbi:MAG: HAD-IB family phosphatase, partial [Parvularculaceae bacterium]|nr:HAD-IB family phosphatase [Parvularculaceae bacterium]